MKKHYTLLFIASVITSTLTADTIELKTGVKYQGKIISEDEKSYLVEVHYSASIKDERRILKEHIRTITSDAKDAKHFETIKKLTPTPDQLNEKSYAKRIKLASSFLKKYPKSTHTKEVKAILETLNAEQAVITKGGIKLDGQLISALDIEANAYDIDARILSNKIKKLAQSGQYQPALRKWEELQKNYANSSSYKDNLRLASRLLKAHQAELNQKLKTLDDRKAQRNQVLKSLEDNDRIRAEKIISEKEALYETLIKKEEKERKTKWLTIDPYHKRALDRNLRSTETELRAISNIDTAKIELAGPHFRGAWSALAQGDLDSAKQQIQNLRSLRLSDKYIDPLTKILEEKLLSQAAEKKAAEEAAVEAEEAAKAAAEKAAEEKTKEESKGRRKKRSK